MFVQKTSRGRIKELWVVPDRDFAPVSISERSSSAASAARTELTDVELTQTDERWLIRRARIVTVSPRLKNDEQVSSYELQEFSPDIKDAGDFIARFPVGTHVFDTRRQMGFVAGKYAEVKDSKGLIARVDLTNFPEYQSLTDKSAGLSNSEYSKTYFAAGPTVKTVTSAQFGPPAGRKALFANHWRVILIASTFSALVLLLGWIYGRKRTRAT